MYFALPYIVFQKNCKIHLAAKGLKQIYKDRDLQTIHYPPVNYWFQYYDLIKFGELSYTCIRMHQKFRGHLRLQTYLHQVKIQFFLYLFSYFVFPALIDNLSNFEIKRLIRLVLSGMFRLPYSASFISFSSFQLRFQEPLSIMDTFLKWTSSKAGTLLRPRRYPFQTVFPVVAHYQFNFSKQLIVQRQQ